MTSKPRKNKVNSDTAANGQGRKVKIKARAEDRLRRRPAVPDQGTTPPQSNDPGVIDETPDPVKAGGPALLEIPEENLDPTREDTGTPLVDDPAFMTVPLDSPGPQSRVQVFRDRILRTVMLPFKRSKKAPNEWYFVVPELREAVRKQLKQVRVCLLYDSNQDGRLFLWTVLESENSPYNDALSRILAQSDQFLKEYLLMIPTADIGGKGIDVQKRLRTPDDPTPVLPSRNLRVLLYEAMKTDRIIARADHPIYQHFARGSRL
jgi:hypothetical protein